MARLAQGSEVIPFDSKGDWREVSRKRHAEIKAKYAKGDGLTGEVIRFSVADGFAQYVVTSVKPLTLVFIDEMDGYRIPEAHIRGLRLKDVEAMVAREKAWEEMFAKKKGA